MCVACYLLNGFGRHLALMHDLDHKNLVVTSPPALQGFSKGPFSQLLHCLILDVESAPDGASEHTQWGNSAQENVPRLDTRLEPFGACCALVLLLGSSNWQLIPKASCTVALVTFSLACRHEVLSQFQNR